MAEKERQIGGNGNNGNIEMTVNNKGKKESDIKATNRFAGHKRNLAQRIVLPPDMLEN